uniref:Retrovirus-related Pol polyprotein from transposon TNT 1-94 n=1 Tax=Nelumbo nucifera TaxID=4432 RepID=A0A822ZPB0_NELNU|nr:TPA_asm: hypothetical protein HUJ06_004530 [Nelumbo nucifera]
MKSTSGYYFSFGSGVFSWCSKKQKIVAQSSVEVEYISASMAASQTIWLRRIVEDVNEKQENATVIRCDNKSSIAMSKNPCYHSRTKHIALKHHFIRDAIEDGEIELIYCRTQEQLADIFVTPLAREKFEELREALGVQ